MTSDHLAEVVPLRPGQSRARAGPGPRAPRRCAAGTRRPRSRSRPGGPDAFQAFGFRRRAHQAEHRRPGRGQQFGQQERADETGRPGQQRMLRVSDRVDMRGRVGADGQVQPRFGGQVEPDVGGVPAPRPRAPSRPSRPCGRRWIASNRTCSGSSASKASRMRNTSFVASSECPPASKKSSSTPIGARRADLPQRDHPLSASVRGATFRGERRLGVGLGVGRSAVLAVDLAVGRRAAGRRAARCAPELRVPAAAPATTPAACPGVGHEFRRPRRRVRRRRPALDPSHDRRAAAHQLADAGSGVLSISPSSIRKPRTLTWYRGCRKTPLPGAARRATRSPVR